MERVLTVHDERPISIGEEVCPGCDGEGRVYQEVRGGRWSSGLGGYVPDERSHACVACDGEARIVTKRCAVCWKIDEDDENDWSDLTARSAHPGWCQCSEGQWEEWIHAHAR